MILLRLAKIPLCLLISFSAFFGYFYIHPGLHSFNLHYGSLIVSFAVFSLAAGGATFNSVQERLQDARMERTRSRPLVTGEISVAAASAVGIVFISIGMLLLWFHPFSKFPFVLGCFALFLYNGVYTPLKRLSVWAIVPGAVCGALPPLIGIAAAGGSLYGFPSLLVFALIALWQVPHYWLVMLAYQSDYLTSRLPNFLQLFTPKQLRRFFITWTGGLAMIMMLFSISPLPLHTAFKFIIIGNSVLMVMPFIFMPKIRNTRDYRRLFVGLNSFLFLHMVLVSLGRLTV